MALATLQDTVVTDVNPPWKMVLSHSPTLEPTLPPQRIFSQYIRSNGIPHNPIEGSSPQAMFKRFRSVGPLVSVRTNVDIGYSQRAIVLEYWYEDDAKLARKMKNTVHTDLKDLPDFSLRTFDPCNLYCTVRAVELVTLFAILNAVNSESGCISLASRYLEAFLWGT